MKKYRVILFSALGGLVPTLFFASWWNFKFIVNIAPGQIFYNRGYPFPFTGFPKGTYYYTNFFLDWLIFSIGIYLFLLVIFRSKKKNEEIVAIEWVTVETFGNRAEAEVEGTLLRAHRIKFRILGDDAGGMFPFPLQPRSGIELQVLKKDVIKAEKLIRLFSN